MRRWHVWAVFGACLVVVLAGMAWSSATVLRLERAELAARALAALEENTRLALWRMDSALTPLLARESGRPYFQYSAFYPAGGAYSRGFAEPGVADALTPSPLLGLAPAHALLHFQLGPGGVLTSPQAPAGALGARALGERHTTAARLEESRSRLARLRGFVAPADLRARLPAEEPPRPRPVAARTPLRPSPSPAALPPQKMKNVKEFEMRQQTLSQSNTRAAVDVERRGSVAEAEVQEGTMGPLWAGEALLLARRVRVNGAVYVQGCWLAWPRLQEELLASVRDLLPGARLERVDGAGLPDDERRLAALPVRLIPGSLPEPAPSGLSPVRLSLIGAWSCVLLAALSVAALLRGVLDLSERRRVFVSAVTHELRTPLTTFRLYTDMLAEGMVAGEEKRREYLDRLRGEAERLSHLVENVLFYSRLESGRAGAVRETVDLAELLRQTVTRLSGSARAAGLDLVLQGAADGAVEARVDRSALEQVLVNLVDNACKYAASSQPPVVHVELQRQDGRAVIRVRDHGPGLTRADRRRLFREFTKSDREAASSRPGVGLGLALSRRLMRAQGGDVALDPTVKEGAAFVITLPATGTG